MALPQVVGLVPPGGGTSRPFGLLRIAPMGTCLPCSECDCSAIQSVTYQKLNNSYTTELSYITDHSSSTEHTPQNSMYKSSCSTAATKRRFTQIYTSIDHKTRDRNIKHQTDPKGSTHNSQKIGQRVSDPPQDGRCHQGKARVGCSGLATSLLRIATHRGHASLASK